MTDALLLSPATSRLAPALAAAASCALCAFAEGEATPDVRERAAETVFALLRAATDLPTDLLLWCDEDADNDGTLVVRGAQAPLEDDDGAQWLFFVDEAGAVRRVREA